MTSPVDVKVEADTNARSMSAEAVVGVERLMAVLRKITRDSRAQFQGPKAVATLTVEQLLVLGELRDQPLTMSRIAQFRGVTPSAATSIVNRLDGRGLIERVPVPSNRRMILIRLTPRGRDIANEVHNRVLRMLSQRLRDLTEEEKAHLDDAITLFEKKFPL